MALLKGRATIDTDPAEERATAIVIPAEWWYLLGKPDDVEFKIIQRDNGVRKLECLTMPPPETDDKQA